MIEIAGCTGVAQPKELGVAMNDKTANKFAFTQNRLEKLAPPLAGRVYVYDTSTPGLALCVTAAGGKTFYWFAKLAGATAERSASCSASSLE